MGCGWQQLGYEHLGLPFYYHNFLYAMLRSHNLSKCSFAETKEVRCCTGMKVLRCTWLGNNNFSDNNGDAVDNSRGDKKYLHNNYYVPDVVLSIVHKPSHFILIMSL